MTGRTHQIRVHAADQGFPVLGDTLYGGTPAARVFLHSEEIAFEHPATCEEMTLRAPADFASLIAQSSRTNPGVALRRALIDPDESNAYRMVHGASDGWPGWYVDRFGEFLLSQSANPLSSVQQSWLNELTATGRFAASTTRHCFAKPERARARVARGSFRQRRIPS